MTTIAILGLGAMGSRMATSLLKAGHALAVWNRSPAAATPLAQAGARVAATPRDAAAGADIVIAMVRDDEASRTVWLDPANGALAGMAASAIGIESSTLTPEWVRQLAASASAAGVDFLDAPVSGSRPQAEAGQLIFLVGGAETVIERARPVLAAMGGAVHQVGVAGDGATLKLAVNALFGIQVAAIAELLGFVGRRGLDVSRVVDILGTMPVCSPAAKGAALSMAAGAFAPMFPVDLVAKDFDYALAAARAAEADTPLAAAARAVFRAAQGNELGTLNLTAVYRLFG